MTRDDGRRDLAKSIPIMDVAHRLGICGLSRAGVEHVGACPVCGDGGKRHPDRFAINPARGVYICRQCSSGGDGLALVQFVLSCDFKSALSYLAGEEDMQPDPVELARRRAAAEEQARKQAEYAARSRAKAIRDAREIWHAAQPGVGTAAEAYLSGRGIHLPEWPPTLRFLPDHAYRKHFADRGVVDWFRGPCMIAAIQDQNGRLTAVHQTFLDPDRVGHKSRVIAPDGSACDEKGKPWPAKLVRGSKKGGAIRLTRFNDTGLMIMGEGIETTLSPLTAGIRRDAVYWAGVDLGNMGGRMAKEQGIRWSGQPDLEDSEAWLPPEGITRLVFLQDGDSDPTSTRAKLLSGLRRAAHHRPGLKGWIVKAEDGRDLNDMLRKAPENDE
ncbi:DUF7146 domain-containing protein [Epibacterium sp. Ofav1-8]|uniref:DUF7146 domain-containing protein n=1 Tax=Epibacterium sp. Ofav1-8 TaxID=2917735 RepID=UPI001EF62AA5|nr:CHC2 zinc finger domain-containing protein [Epibacterium sp. Ofav1-8]MCG7626035.1 CHC2 zinc finger domain-containing protein [Epibacterium sp. Ofav1-8]